MNELKLYVPTYNAHYFPDEVRSERLSEFGVPMLPVVIREADSLRIVLGTHNYDEAKAPDIEIERQPNGWVVFLHPLGGGDLCGCLYFRDDGRNYFQMERGLHPTETIEILDPGDDVPGFDHPAKDSQ